MSEVSFTREGTGPTVLLSHSLGCNLEMWDAVAAMLLGSYTVLRYDHRGHGRSPAARAPLSIDDLADDAAALIEREVREPVHFVGLSMGGMVAQSLAARYPKLVRSVVIANSSSHYDEGARALWQARVATVRAGGLAAIAEGVMERWFTAEFRADEIDGGAEIVRRVRGQLEDCDPASYAACCEAVARIDLRQGNAAIACPALVIAGQRDEATPAEMSKAIMQEVPLARLRTIDAAHLSAVEKPREFTALLSEFWRSLQRETAVR